MMRFARFYRLLIPLLITSLLTIQLVPDIRYVLGSPYRMRMLLGEEQSLDFGRSLRLTVDPPKDSSLIINNTRYDGGLTSHFDKSVKITPENTGEIKMSLKLFGIVPIRKMIVDVIPAIKVIPCGQAIGVLLTSDGVMVVAHTSLEGIDGVRRYPAEEAGIEIGDVILKVNGEKVNGSQHVSELVNKHGSGGTPLILEIRRGGKILTKELRPILAKADKRGGYGGSSLEYKMGLYVEDNVAGVGTLTFYSPETKKYAALGHVITDANTNQKIQIREGKIVGADISGIEQGQRGQPGEKIGSFEDSASIVGNIKKNTDFGIYGELSRFPSDRIFKNPIPIAVSSQIKEGPAEILTVIQNHSVERFKVEIQKVYQQSTPRTKGLIVKVVDPKLLSVTGGIIQGMSGSPIIQNDRLVGAVTHVFVNDPTRGYGVLAEWMVMEAGLVQKQNTEQPSKPIQKDSVKETKTKKKVQSRETAA